MANANFWVQYDIRHAEGVVVTDSLIFHLLVTGLDLDDPAHDEVLDWPEADLYPSELDGQQLLTVQSTEPVEDAVDFVLDTVAYLTSAIEGLTVHGLDQDLVGATDIANRVGVSRETVRLWATARRGSGDFPSALGVVNGGRKVWDWASVNDWVRSHTSHGRNEVGLSRAEHARVDALLRCRGLRPMPAAWAATAVLADMARYWRVAWSVGNVTSHGFALPARDFTGASTKAWLEVLPGLEGTARQVPAEPKLAWGKLVGA